MLKAEPDSARALADAIVKNTYRTLMTRGMKGCYVCCTDAPLATYLRSRFQSGLPALPAVAAADNGKAVAAAASPARSDVVPLPRVTKEERDAGVVAALVDLRFAAGAFSDAQALWDGPDEWVALPDWVRPQPGLFVAQVVGESMNRRIPNGARCLFRANPTGTRQGKVVVVQHRSIADPETGGRYTFKLYASEKMPAGDGQLPGELAGARSRPGAGAHECSIRWRAQKCQPDPAPAVDSARGLSSGVHKAHSSRSDRRDRSRPAG